MGGYGNVPSSLGSYPGSIDMLYVAFPRGVWHNDEWRYVSVLVEYARGSVCNMVPLWCRAGGLVVVLVFWLFEITWIMEKFMNEVDK